MAAIFEGKKRAETLYDEMREAINNNKIILDECSTVVEIDHVRNLKDCLERKNG